ncbi:MAG: trypsin-like peptidase domain-containing protein [Blastopirellula sp. JB062]
MTEQQHSKWYVKSAEEVFGPYSVEEMKQYGEQGFIWEDHEIRKGEEGTWVLAESVRGLKVRKRTAAPTPPVIPATRPSQANRDRRRQSPVSTRTLLIFGLPAALLLVVIGVIGLAGVDRSGNPAQNANQDESNISIITGKQLIFFGDHADRPMSTREIAQANECSVFLLQGTASVGTGFLVNERMIVTNSHVIASEAVNGATGEFENLKAYSPAAKVGRRGPFKVTLLAEDTKCDLAVLLLSDRVEFPPVMIARDYKFQRGQEITIIGNPSLFGREVLNTAVTKGVMSTVHKIDGFDHYQMGAAVNPGNSGGPVFDEFGRVIGVVRSKSQNEEQISFCIPIHFVVLRIIMADSKYKLKEVWTAHNINVRKSVAAQMAPPGTVVSLASPPLEVIPVASSDDDLAAMMECVGTGNVLAFEQLVSSGRCMLTPAGTRAQVINSDIFCRVRLLDGPYTGRTGLVSMSCLR